MPLGRPRRGVVRSLGRSRFIGRGYCAALWCHALERARELGFTAMELAADPTPKLFIATAAPSPL